MTGYKIRLSKCSVGEKEVAAAERAIRSEYLGMGVEVQLFEQEIASYLNTEFDVVCVNSGTSALVLALSALGIGTGDEVLVPTITYVASFQAISAVGATPVACDINIETGFLNVDDARLRVTSKTKAIMPVHYASNSSGMADVYNLAKEHGLRVVEDAAQAFGCQRDGEMVGAVGDIICFSFDGIKNITCGEGGAVLTSDHSLADKMRDARLLGVVKDTEQRFAGQRSWDFDVNAQGFRFHLSNINAAIGRVQLGRLNSFAKKRKMLVQRYNSLLKDINEIELMNIDDIDTISHIYVVKAQARDRLQSYLSSVGVETGHHYKPNHLLTFYENGMRLEVAENFYSTVLTLPLHVDLTLSQQDYILEQIRIFYASYF